MSEWRSNVWEACGEGSLSQYPKPLVRKDRKTGRLAGVAGGMGEEEGRFRGALQMERG